MSDIRRTADAIPSLSDSLGRHARAVTLVGGHELPTWFPDLPLPPEGWTIGRTAAAPTPTRILLSSNVYGSAWDGCGVLNLFTFTGRVPTELVEARVDATLRIAGALNIDRRAMAMPAHPELCVAAASAAGEVTIGGRRLRSRFTAYLVQKRDIGCDSEQGGTRGALVEHNMFLAAEANDKTERELFNMDDQIHSAMMKVLS